MNDKPDAAVRTTERSLDIIEALQRLDGARLTELAAELGLPNSTVHNHLTTLVNRGYVVKESHRYHVGLRFLDHGEYARRSRRGFDIAREELRALAESTNETALLLTAENGTGVVLESARESDAAPLDLRPGTRIELHTSGIGRAYLAYLSNDRVAELISDLEGSGRAIDDVREFFDYLERVRQRGYDYDRGERLASVASVGTALKDESGTIVASIGVAGAKNRFSEDRIADLVDRLQTTANVIELYIAHS
ncbi:IclR family transcriptional regulator [Halosolutus gelatinilyticus]|uniref:IclR family transcriptional regulator n=1 Tax=Halosolutus gelatinilyticus TaxID=2931975 RepID=UPI001FF4A3EF|nr:IclR family transcriptional regulator [Halosolutus gelatinilyticus]